MDRPPVDEMGESPETIAAAWRFIGPLIVVGLIAIVVGLLRLKQLFWEGR